MESKKNRYEQEATKRGFLGEIAQDLETKGDLKNSTIETAKDLVIGAVGGGFAGAALGRPSLLVGILVTGVGHYTNNRLISSFGVGMMASNVFQKDAGVSGTPNKDMLEGIKERVSTYKDGFLQKLFVDKLMPKKDEKKTETTSGVGQVQYFSALEEKELEGSSGLDLSAMDNIERRVAESGEAFERKQEMKGFVPIEEVMGELDPQERNY